MPQDLPPVGGYEPVQYKVRLKLDGTAAGACYFVLEGREHGAMVMNASGVEGMGGTIRLSWKSSQ
jgi:hypothetical protein